MFVNDSVAGEVAVGEWCGRDGSGAQKRRHGGRAAEAPCSSDQLSSGPGRGPVPESEPNGPCRCKHVRLHFTFNCSQSTTNARSKATAHRTIQPLERICFHPPCSVCRRFCNGTADNCQSQTVGRSTSLLQSQPASSSSSIRRAAVKDLEEDKPKSGRSAPGSHFKAKHISLFHSRWPAPTQPPFQ